MKSRPVILGKIKVKSLTDGLGLAEEVDLPEGRSSRVSHVLLRFHSLKANHYGLSLKCQRTTLCQCFQNLGQKVSRFHQTLPLHQTIDPWRETFALKRKEADSLELNPGPHVSEINSRKTFLVAEKRFLDQLVTEWLAEIDTASHMAELDERRFRFRHAQDGVRHVGLP